MPFSSGVERVYRESATGRAKTETGGDTNYSTEVQTHEHTDICFPDYVHNVL